MTRPSDAAPEQGGEGLREAVEHLANLAAEHLNCSGCPTPWWLTNWLANERTSRRTIAHLEPQAAHTDEGAGLSEAERMHLARCVYAVTGYLPPKNVNDLSGVLNEIEHYVERIVAQRVELANAVPALIAENERLGARLAEVERDANGPGWFWTRTEWAEWSNHLTTLIPEDLFAGNPEGAQESVIEDTITHLVAALVRVTQERDAERAQVAAGLAAWNEAVNRLSAAWQVYERMVFDPTANHFDKRVWMQHLADLRAALAERTEGEGAKVPDERSKAPVSDAGVEAAPENANGVTRPSAAGNGEEGEQ